MQTKNSPISVFFLFALTLLLSGCVPQVETLEPQLNVPETFANLPEGESAKSEDTLANTIWSKYFGDQHLIDLIDAALQQNQELRIFSQQILIAQNEILARQGAYLPSVELGADAGLDKVGEYTRKGAVESNLEIAPDKSFPDPLPDFFLGAQASWEIDIWSKLRNAEKSAFMEYLASAEGRKFLLTNLIAEVANSYFELLALDSQLDLVQQNIAIQSRALQIVRLKKQGARVTELALRRFEAQLFKTRSLQYGIQQNIVEVENRINFLLGRYPQAIPRNAQRIEDLHPAKIGAGFPTELLENRPDVKRAELELAAANLNVEVARARFYPSLRLTGSYGYSAYDTAKLFESPQSMLYALGGSLTAPFINRRDIEAMYRNASAKQIQSVIDYEQAVLKAFIEVTNQISNIDNLEKNYLLKSQQVKALNESVEISTTLFNAARADYMEVLLTQREALDARFELIETKMSQFRASIALYRALGGGWQQAKDGTS
ncbi:MAG: efflux transporter outer membrane subunit [Bdellovibrionales bacterium]|nr:efflux transporter outer membrane subunit [Bdellovibrionales bacterium]